jgi:protein-S-isoprenylcysteine O-methyltransferase Ste14
VILFGLYFTLWKSKQIQQIKATGKDPEVMSEASSNLQQYMDKMLKVVVLYGGLIIIFHAAGVQVGSLFSRVKFLSKGFFDIIGFLIGLVGLAFCLYAQIKMGTAWRVGIDVEEKTELITTGLYNYIRNPTYLGLFILDTGVWLIWPTWTVFILNLTLFLLLEVQVCCEEDYLSSVHGDKYREYQKSTNRYLPFIY